MINITPKVVPPIVAAFTEAEASLLETWGFSRLHEDLLLSIALCGHSPNMVRLYMAPENCMLPFEIEELPLISKVELSEVFALVKEIASRMGLKWIEVPTYYGIEKMDDLSDLKETLMGMLTS